VNDRPPPRRATEEDLERLAERLAEGDESIERAFEGLPFAEHAEEDLPPEDELKP